MSERRKQIEEAIKNHDSLYTAEKERGFFLGAEWADENPVASMSVLDMVLKTSEARCNQWHVNPTTPDDEKAATEYNAGQFLPGETYYISHKSFIAGRLSLRPAIRQLQENEAQLQARIVELETQLGNVESWHERTTEQRNHFETLCKRAISERDSAVKAERNRCAKIYCGCPCCSKMMQLNEPVSK